MTLGKISIEKALKRMNHVVLIVSANMYNIIAQFVTRGYDSLSIKVSKGGHAHLMHIHKEHLITYIFRWLFLKLKNL